MGSAISRPDDSSLLALCKERRSLIGSALHAHSALADAHSAYFRSLQNVGTALHRFILEDMTVIPSPLTIPSDDRKPNNSITDAEDSRSEEPLHLSEPIPAVAYQDPSEAIPAVAYQDPSGYVYTPYPGYGAGYQAYHDNPVPAQGDAYAYYDQLQPSQQPGTPPLPSWGSAWDIFNVFFVDHHGSPDSNEVREQEGIPELEEDIEHDVQRGKQPVVDEDVGTSRNKGDSGSSSHDTESSSSVGELGGERKGVVSNAGSSMVTEEGGLCNVDGESTSGTRDVMEALDEVKERFKAAAGFGEEVARMLEVGSVQYRPRCGILTGTNSGIRNLMDRATSTFSHMSFKRPRVISASQIKTTIEYADHETYDMNSTNLSSILEKLYMWEKKLYKEVKDEETVHAMYNKNMTQLKDLALRGEQQDKINDIQASAKNFSVKMSIFIRSINFISNTVQKIRDEELQPELMKLIQGLMKMWRLVLDCHQKQFQALALTRSDILVAKSSSPKTYVSRATKDLEREILQWRSCFNNWIRTQRDYIASLKKWLSKHLIQELDVASKEDAYPTDYIIFNAWYHAIEKVSEVEASEAMHSFANILHEMRVNQKKERDQRRKVEEISRRLKYVQKKNGLHVEVTTGNAMGNNNVVITALYPLRKRLDEKRGKHEEIKKHIQLTSSKLLETGLVPTFEALRKFTMETVKAYDKLEFSDQIRIQ